MKYLALLFVSAYFFSQLEIQIEGKNFWASKLPTWRRSSKIMEMITGRGKDLTGYHLNLFLFIFTLVHIPYLFIYPTVRSELTLISFFVFLTVLEDFFWILFNPHFGFKKFTKSVITWHREWTLGVPTYYIYGITAGGILLALANR